MERCDRCAYERIAYNSCRNRHCPKCQGRARWEWTEARAAEILPVHYFHVVFTLPNEIAPLALQNQKPVYDILFRAASETLMAIAADPKHLGARIGVLAVLHTWGQNLMHHPHLHCVVPGGGLSSDCDKWIACAKTFFLPVRVLSRVFRGKFIQYLKEAWADGKLRFHGQLAHLSSDEAFRQLLNRSCRQEWVVHAKPPFGGPEQVLRYLARYTHRVAIANSRLVRLENGRVAFRWKDYSDGNRIKTMALSAEEFMRRFLLHVVPRGFVRIRYYGFLANRFRAKYLQQCRRLLDPHDAVGQPEPLQHADQSLPTPEPAEGERCPRCTAGRMKFDQPIEPRPWSASLSAGETLAEFVTTKSYDTS